MRRLNKLASLARPFIAMTILLLVWLGLPSVSAPQAPFRQIQLPIEGNGEASWMILSPHQNFTPGTRFELILATPMGPTRNRPQCVLVRLLHKDFNPNKKVGLLFAADGKITHEVKGNRVQLTLDGPHMDIKQIPDYA